MMPDAQGLPPVACSQFDGSDVTPPPLMTLTVRVSFSNTYLVKCYKMLYVFMVGTMHHVHGVICAGAQAATGVRWSQYQPRAQTPKNKTLNPCIIKPSKPARRVELRVQCCAVAVARPRRSWGEGVH
jgi:hypothetical protein